MKQTCKQCGKEFELTQGEISFYESKGLDLPKRCKDCREANKSGKGNSSSAAPKRETLTTTKSSAESGWPFGKLIATGIAAIVIVLAALFGGGMLGGTTPVGNTTNAGNTAAVTNTSNTTNAANTSNTNTADTKQYHFRSSKLLNEHYDKHGKEMGFKSAEAYESAASAVVTNPAALHKSEKEDNDDVYYLEKTREFVVVSTDGYIRTYYYADKDYFNRQ